MARGSLSSGGAWLHVVALAAMARPSSSHLDRQSPQAARSLLKLPPQGYCFATLVTPMLHSTKTLRHGESAHRALCMSRGEDGRMVGSGRDSANSALQRAIKILQDGGIPESSASAELLLSAVIGQTRSHLRVNGAQIKLTSEQARKFESYVDKRLARSPVQYILGEWDFYNLDNIVVRPPTLIPRPETEELVDMIVKAHSIPPARFLEVGPGSGAICLSLLKAWPLATAVAVDLCEHACLLTEENAARMGMSSRLRVQHVGIAEFALGGEDAKFDLLVSNPPYIPSQDMATLEPEVISYEDPIALDGGADGLLVIRQILAAARDLVRPGGGIWMEVDESHPELLAGGEGCPRGVRAQEWFRDMYGRPRFVRWVVLDAEG